MKNPSLTHIYFIKKLSLPVLAALAFTALPVSAQLYWNGADTQPDAGGGNGTWVNGVTANWKTAATGGSNSTWTNGTTTAVFGGTAGTVALGSNITVGSMTMNTPGYTFTSTGLQTLTFQNALTGTLAQLFTGDLALKWVSNQNNNSTILTNGNNTFSGGITVGSSVNNDRFLLSGNTIGSGTPGALTNGVWGTGALTLGVTTADRAQILFNSASTINNAIVVNSAVGNSDAAGAFRVDSSNNVINGAINANLADAAFRNGNNGAGAITVTGAISGNSGLALLAGNGVGTLNVTLSNNGTANSYAGNTTISSVRETLTLGAANQISNGAGKGNLIVTGGTFRMGGFSETINGLSGNGTVDGFSGTPTLTVGDNDATSNFSGVIRNTAGTLALTKTGNGTLTLSGNNTYGGATTISSGTLTAGSVTGLSASSAHSVATGATLDLGGFNNTIKSLSTSGGNITNSTGSATLRIADAMSGTLNSHLFTGSLGLQLYGGNTVNTILSNTANTYSGGTILGNGTGVTNTRWLGSGTVGAGSPGAVTSGIFGTGAITIGAATTDRSQFYFAGITTINNAIVVNSAQGDGAQFGAFRHEAPGSNVVIAGTVNANLADVMVLAANGNTTRTLSFTNTISGNSGLQVVTQAAALLNVTLNNAGTANSYAGHTTIGTANSSLTLGRADQIPNGVGKGNLIITGGTFNMGGFSETINGLSGNGTVDGISGTPTLTVGDNNASSTFSGVIQNTAGTLALTKTGNGTLTFTSANTYSGATTINAGTLLINGNQSGATGAVAVNNGATLGGNGTVGGTVTVNSGGILSPGNSPGLQNMTSLALTDGGNYNWQVVDATGVAGTGFDSINLSGSLDLSALTGGTDFQVNLWSLSSTGPDVNGNATNFNNTLDQSWTLVSTGNVITGFDATEFAVNVGANAGTNGFTNPLATGSFSVALSGDSTDLMLVYTAIPEPATWALMAFSLTTVMVLRRRRNS